MEDEGNSNLYKVAQLSATTRLVMCVAKGD